MLMSMERTMNEEWCCEQLANLKIRENRLNTLTEIRGQLNACASLERIVTNRLMSAPEIYDCLLDEQHGHSGGGPNEQQQQQFDIASDILSICMSNLSISQNDLPQLLQRALHHPRAQIRALALNSILKVVQQRQQQDDDMQFSSELLLHVLETLQQRETEVGVPSISILSVVLEHRVDDPIVKERLLGMLNCDEIIKCRVYELAVNLAKRSPATLHRVEYLLDSCLDELDNDDVLLQVNVLEILVPLAEQNHGLLYLERRQVFELLSRRIELLEQNPLDQLLVPAIMKFFGKVASMQPQKIILGYPLMIECLFECFHSGDMALLPIAFDTMANLAITQQGKHLLDVNYADGIRQIFDSYATYLRNLSSELKVRAFNTLEVIFTSQGQASAETSAILQRWFTYLVNATTMAFLMDFCRNPFPDIKIACLSLIKALCAYAWGIQALKSTAGFVEFLLDRKIEFDKESKYAKYEVIKLLADSNAFDGHMQTQLQTYINEGPYFVQSIMEIAVEGN